MLPLTPIMDDLDQVFMDSQTWQGANGTGSAANTRDPSLGIPNLNSPPLSHEQFPNVSVVPTSYAGHFPSQQTQMAHQQPQQQQQQQHSTGQTPYFPDGHGHPDLAPGSAPLPSQQQATHGMPSHNYGQGFASQASAALVAQQQQQQ
eukprot:scpid106450/ scgid6340/ 